MMMQTTTYKRLMVKMKLTDPENESFEDVECCALWRLEGTHNRMAPRRGSHDKTSHVL
jgi:hypothetical protein